MILVIYDEILKLLKVGVNFSTFELLSYVISMTWTNNKQVVCDAFSCT